MTEGTWLEAHPYLQPLARLHAQVDTVVGVVGSTDSSVPAWNEYAADYLAGVPLLRSSDCRIDLEPGGEFVRAVLERLASDSGERMLREETRALLAQLEGQSGASALLANWLMGDDTWTPVSPGLLRWLGWQTLEHYLRPLRDAFSRWREEERWLRRYCPMCGSLPSMAQLVGVDPGRQRFLSCGRCRTRWRYGRTACPFCEAQSHRLVSLAVDGEGGLRIDYCEACHGYLKTYNGHGDETLLLSDWTSLHLDLIAGERGLHRAAASLYELESAVNRT